MCSALIYPTASTPGERDNRLRISSSNGTDISIEPIQSPGLEKIEIVVGDFRQNFEEWRFRDFGAWDKSPQHDVLADAARFHLTALKDDGTWRSSRFEDVDFDAILDDMAESCGFVLQDPEAKAIEDALELSPEQIRTLKWIVYLARGKPREFRHVDPDTDDRFRRELTAFLRERGKRPSRYFDRDTIRLILDDVGLMFPPVFEDTSDFDRDLAAVRIGGRWGLINADGDFILRPVYDEARPVQHGFLPVRSGSTWSIIDSKGDRRTVPRVHAISSCSAGWCIYEDGRKMGLVSLGGDTRTDAEYDWIGPFGDGFAPARAGKQWFFLDANASRRPVDGDFSDLAAPSGGLALYRSAITGKYGFISMKDGGTVAEGFDEAGPFSGGLAAVRSGDKWGYIDRAGTFAVSPDFEAAGAFSRGLAPARQNGLWGYIDKSGRFVIPPQFARAEPFSQGYAVVEARSGKFGLMSLDGRMKLQPWFDAIRPFSDGRAAVRIGEKWSFVSRSALR